MLYFNNIYKILFGASLLFAILLSATSRAEEASILTGATVIGTDIRDDRQAFKEALISGYYKSNCVSTGEVSGNMEFVIDL